MPPKPVALARIASTSRLRARIDPALGGAVARGVSQEARRQFLVRRSEWRLKSRQPGIRPVHRGNLSSPLADKGAPIRPHASPRLQADRCSASNPSPCPANGQWPSRPRRAAGMQKVNLSCPLLGEGHRGEPSKMSLPAVSIATLVNTSRSGATISRIRPSSDKRCRRGRACGCAMRRRAAHRTRRPDW